jgi:polysaccharide export outer membrane protein
MSQSIRYLILLLTMLGVAPSLAMAQTDAPAASTAPASAAPTSPVSAGYVLGAGDTVEVGVLDASEYKASVKIEQDGTVVLPLVGRVTAAGQSITQFRDSLRTRLISGGFFVKPEVSVTLVSATSRYATVLGEVGSPGLVPLDRDYHLSEIVARVGGLKGAGIDIITVTTADGTANTYSMRAAATGGGNADPLIKPGDKVFVAPPQVFYISGEVTTAGVYPVEAGMTVRQALARAGGLTATGSKRKVTLVRGNKEYKIDLDEKIQSNDTISVGQRFF